MSVLVRHTGMAVEPVTLGGAFLERVSDNWGAPGAVPVGWLLGAAAVLVGILLGIWTYRWWRTWDQRPHPWLVYWRIARELGFSVSDRLLLARIARQQGLPSGLTLLASRQTLRIHSLNYAAGGTTRKRARVLACVNRARRRLFG